MRVLFLLLFSLSLSAEEPKLSWTEANVYCISVNRRLPTMDELDRIIPKNKEEKSWWSSSRGGENGAWIISSGKSRYLYETKNNIHYVKCL